MRSKFKWIFSLLLALSMQVVSAQVKTVSGTVSDAVGPIPGVNVMVKGTKNGTQTSFDGSYAIKAKQGDVLVFSFVGMKDVSKAVDASDKLNVKLESNEAEKLEEVVVVGYGVQRKKEITGAISQIKGDAIAGLVSPSFESLLGGRSAGVQVTAPNGILGQAPTVRIRGVASISSGTQPLYIVDGMPIYSGDLGGYANANGLGDINPNDIESFEVLKDGAATAIYGSRAANGVILITTKKGKKGSAKVSYNTTVGFSSPIKTFDLLNTNQFLTIANEKRTNIGQPIWAAGSTFNTDWQKAVLRENAVQIDHNLSFSGGTDQTKYFMSLGYTDQEGIAKSNEMTRYNFRTNIEHKLNDWFSFGGNIALSRTDYSGLNTGRGSVSGNIFNAIRNLPNVPIYNAANPTGYNITTNNWVGQWDNLQPVGVQLTNVVYGLENNRQTSSIQRLLINTFAAVDITKDLNFRFQASADNAITGGFLYWSPIHGDGFSVNGRLQNDNLNSLRWNIQNILSYNKTFLDDHNVSATAVAEYQSEKNQYFEGVGTDLADGFYDQNLVTGAYTVQTANGSVGLNSIMSYIGRVSYNYKQKYFLQGSIRRDGLSKLSPATRWSNFTGYSAGWNIANENFMSGIKEYVSDFKLRASYSEVGNTDIGNFPYLGLTSASQYGAANGIAYTQFGNDQLQWEKSKKTDFGADLSILNNKIKLTADYFKNDIEGMILNVPVAPSLGVPNNRIAKNIGALENTGLEFGVEAALINNANFKWSVNANLTLQKSVVTSLPSGNADIVGGSSSDININPNIIIRTNESPNSLFGYEYWGVNKANGNPVYVKANGSLVQGNLNNGTYVVFDPSNPSDISKASSLALTDRKILGNTLPTYFGGFSSNMSYKNFDLAFLVRFSGGNKIFNSTRREMLNQDLNNNSTEVLGRWQSATNPGDGWTPKLMAGQGNFVNLASFATTRFVENGDFISLDNVSIGYSLPKSIVEKLKLDKFRIFLQAQNMLIITDYKGINPEMETFGVDLNGTPRAKTISMGLNVNL
ncbi:TonB-linked outer membrane protein, SusC/RagA family [Flavobacterium succinicans]|uniref:TonB-linked outer membrane protein, SusC/RagA family n=1 Tax=Flavobacterium succinicans TaxID=29536 RepID=A0A1I4QPS1_9FLAO|nr:TonB-dependent receptor [Flavobacterium succinicans]SFM42098.1 TonB-linked outer membrane protein, SusC/RagA family [Flavobacterium succinicans]